VCARRNEDRNATSVGLVECRIETQVDVTVTVRVLIELHAGEGRIKGLEYSRKQVEQCMDVTALLFGTILPRWPRGSHYIPQIRRPGLSLID
jgi:hypothetical protein